MIFHNSQKIFYRSPFGAQPTNTNITLRVKATKRVVGVTLRLWYSEGVEVKREMTKCEKGGFFEASFLTNDSPGWVWYYFIVTERGGSETIKEYYYGNTPDILGGIGTASEVAPNSYQVTVHSREANTPNWAKDGTMYHIFVDRFKRGSNSPALGTGLKNGQVFHPHWKDEPLYGRDENGNVLQYDFFGGDLAGIIEALPYLQSLGVTILYLSPIMDSVSNHKYDVGNYKTVDRAFGDDRIFRVLTAKAHAYGVKVILDGVFSHTGAESVYFNRSGSYPGIGAAQSTTSPYYSWYSFDEYPQTYRCWWGMTNMPEVNEEDEAYQRFLLWEEDSVIRRWHQNGIDGWRLDVADELPDSFLQPFHEAVKAINPEAFILGEVWEDASRKESYGTLRPYFQGYELDSVMNYPFRTVVIDVLKGNISPRKGMAKLCSLYENYPLHVFYSLMNLLSSHDERRILTELGEAPSMKGWTQEQRQTFRLTSEKRALAERRLKAAVLWQFTFPGIPDIYYGDEVGLEGDTDPYNRRTYPRGNEIPELQNWFRFLGNLRRRHTVLRTGTFEPIPDEELIAYKRSTEGGIDVFDRDVKAEEAYVWLNPGNEPVRRKISLSKEYSWRFWTEKGEYYLLSEQTIQANHRVDFGAIGTVTEIMTDEVILAPEGFCLILGEPVKSNEYNASDEGDGTEDIQKKEYGVLLHPTSLPSPDGIGDLGQEAYKWVDLLSRTNHHYWQILPLTTPAEGNSPYTAYSGTAGDTRLIAMDELVADGLLTSGELEIARRNSPGEGWVQPQAVIAYKESLLTMAWNRFTHLKTGPLRDEFEIFKDEQSPWLNPYSIFEAQKMKDRTVPWTEWGMLATYDDTTVALAQVMLHTNIEVVKFWQWLFYRQWQKLHEYAREHDVCIIGDLPFFVAQDSADVWANREMFDLDEEGNPQTVAGVPPDYFSPTGQHWGNPQYNWDIMKKDGYSWWIQNLKQLLLWTDIVRLDHFRGYESFWSIPAEAPTAATGSWVKGPGMDLFNAVMTEAGPLPLIAEDLGVITPAVEELRLSAGLRGMKVLQFSFSEDPVALSNLEDRIVYTGTHDNNTLFGWLCSLKESEDMFTLRQLTDYLGLPTNASNEIICEALLREAYELPCCMTIVPMQDLLDPEIAFRMNVPGEVNDTNWLWRLPANYLTDTLEKKMKNFQKKA